MRRIQRTLRACVIAAVGALLCVGSVAADPSEAPASSRFTLRFAEFSFDPLVEQPTLPAGWDRSLQQSPDLRLVQFDGAIPGDAFERLRAAGLEPVQYVHPDTYITWGRAADRDRLRGRPHIRWTGDFAPAFRVESKWRDRRGETVDVRVLIYRGSDVDAVTAALSTFGEPQGELQVIDDHFAIAGYRIPGELMRYAAAIPGVYSIQPSKAGWVARAEVAAQIDAGNVDALNVAFPGYQAWLADAGLDGSGVTVAVVDEGVDETHPDLIASYLPCTGDSCTTAPSIHGTHVAGILTGDGVSGVMDANGFLRGLGIAPGAGFFEQEFILFRYLPGGVFALMTDSVRNGATISNNSWGVSSSALGYNADAMMIDAGVRDADPVAPGNQSLLYVQALGNGNGGVSSQGTPDDAKNVLSVGSTWAVNQLDENPNPYIDSLSDNSAHGPALDGRRIPNVVAPGCRVDSTVSDFAGGYDHFLLCGTSMATPQVSGAAALFTELYRGLPGVTADPSPALIKAAVMVTAHDLAGNEDADGVTMGHRPDSKQGWGRLDLAALVRPEPGTTIYYDQKRVFEESGESWLREVTPVDPAQPMRIMLTWTDAPGPGLGGATPAWANDLDLVVDAGGQTYLGNVFGADGWSATGGSAEFMNNSEGVFLELPPSSVTIRVVAGNINSDGVPNFNDETDQDFALVCVNCAFASGFDLNPEPVTAQLCAPDPAEYAIDVESHVGFADPVSLTLTGVPPEASAGFDVNPVTPGGLAVLSIDPGTLADGDYAFQLDGDAAGLNRSHPLYLRLRTAVPAAAAPSLPAPAAVDVSPQPVLEWAAVPWAASYVVEVSTDPTFQQIFYSGFSTAPMHAVEEVLAQGTQYYWRVRARNVCGFGTFSAVSSFTTVDLPDVLLVDDDWDYWGDFQADYTDALDALPLDPWFYDVTYDVWDVYGVQQQEEPDYWTLSLYDKVIWWSGNEDFYAGPTNFSELDLAKWFDRRGGCLLLSSSDFVLVRDGVDSFMQQRLGVASAVEDTGMGEVTGQGVAFGGLGTIGLRNINPDYSDTIVPDATAELAFAGDLGDAGIAKDGGWYRTAFLGFGAERLFQPADREAAVLDFLQWCDGLAAIDGDGDGVANADDCVPGDATAWTAPEPVTDLTLGKGTVGFSWSVPFSGGGSVYDLLRSNDPTDFWNATCVASGIEQPFAPAAWDDDPPPGGLRFYLVRARGACGAAPLGSNLDGTPRQGTACE